MPSMPAAQGMSQRAVGDMLAHKIAEDRKVLRGLRKKVKELEGEREARRPERERQEERERERRKVRERVVADNTRLKARINGDKGA